MDDLQNPEETAFVVDEITHVVNESIKNVIGNNVYEHSRVKQWTSSLTETCLNQLSRLAKPFKYIVTCVIMQNNGAGLQSASSCFWDNTTDGCCTIKFESSSLCCIVSVFGLAI